MNQIDTSVGISKAPTKSTTTCSAKMLSNSRNGRRAMNRSISRTRWVALRFSTIDLNAFQIKRRCHQGSRVGFLRIGGERFGGAGLNHHAVAHDDDPV